MASQRTPLLPLPPRVARAQAFLAEAAEHLPANCIALAVLDRQAPQPEGFLAVRDLPAASIVAWCDAGAAADPAWSQAAAAPSVRYRWADHQGASPLLGTRHGLFHTLPASLDAKRAWLLAAGRESEPFTEPDLHKASLLLRRYALAVDTCPTGLGRLLLDRQNRLLHADPHTEARLLEHLEQLPELAERVRTVAEQRWPDNVAARPHDLVLPLEDGPTWITLDQTPAAPDLPAPLELELRIVTPEDTPAVGLVGDDRIARAMGYLTDHHPLAPSLHEVAAAVHISPFHFHRLFSREVGASPKHFLLRTQMMVAKWLLRGTRTPVNQVARQTGFTSHGHFTATFHRLVGVSPTTFRDRA